MGPSRKAEESKNWLSLDAAAEHLAVSQDALRKRLQRAARKAKDGAIEASIDGVYGRKLGKVWRVRLGVWS